MRRALAMPLAVVAVAAGAPAAHAAGWLPPVDVSTASGFAPDVAVSPAGDVVAAWLESDVVVAAVRPRGGPLTPAVPLSEPGESASPPRVAIDAAGDAVVVWTGSNGSHDIVRAASRPAGGAFSDPVNLSENGQDASPPALAVDTAGDAIVAWTRSNGTSDVVQVATRAARAAGFSSATDLSTSGQSASNVDVAVSPGGEAIAVWTRASVLQAATRAPEGAFAAPVDVTAPGEIAFGPRAGIADDGSAVVAWDRPQFANGQAHVTVRGAIRDGHGAFGAPVDLSEPGVAGGQLQVAVNPAGRAIVVWEQFTGSTSASILGVAERAPGAPFGAADDLDPDCWTPDVALDPAGGAMVVCRAYDFHAGIVTTQAFTRSAPGPFSEPLPVTAAGEEGYNTVVASDAAGNTVAVYQGDRIRATVHDVTAPALSSVAVPETATAGAAVTMSAAATDEWGPATVSFAFGDGTSAAAGTASHTYAAAGTYDVAVTAADAAGNATTVHRTITVAPAPSGGDTPSGGGGTTTGEGGGTTGGGGSTPNGGTGTTGQPPAAPAVTPATVAAGLAPRGAAAKIRRILVPGYAVPFSAPAPGRLTVRWLAAAGGKAKASKQVVVAKGARSFAAAGKDKIALKLTRAGRRLLKRTKKVTLTAKATFTPAAGGAPVKATKRFVVKR